MTQIGTLGDGRAAHRIEISAGTLTAGILTWGAILQSVRMDGVPYDLTRTPERLEDWTSGRSIYHGALVAPVANRFSGARAPLGDRMLDFEANQDGLHMLHSGSDGTHSMLWEVTERAEDSVTLWVDLPAGAGGFPGNRRLVARFSAAPPATLRLEIEAVTDALTFFNATNHSYWNLDGGPTWDGHSLRIAADRWLPTDETDAPTGEIADVAGGPMDFRQTQAPAPGTPPLDHNFCLSDGRTALREVLWLTGRSGCTMAMATTEPGMQVYDGRKTGHDALALEAQGWPDAPNHAAFPSILLRPGEAYRNITEWRFGRVA